MTGSLLNTESEGIMDKWYLLRFLIVFFVFILWYERWYLLFSEYFMIFNVF